MTSWEILLSIQMWITTSPCRACEKHHWGWRKMRSKQECSSDKGWGHRYVRRVLSVDKVMSKEMKMWYNAISYFFKGSAVSRSKPLERGDIILGNLFFRVIWWGSSLMNKLCKSLSLRPWPRIICLISVTWSSVETQSSTTEHWASCLNCFLLFSESIYQL